MTWKPSKFDLDWTASLIKVVAEGATWGTTFGIYVFRKESKTLELIFRVPGQNAEDERERVRLVFEELGWKVNDISNLREEM